MSKNIALLAYVPFEVLIVNKDIAYCNSCPISISLDFESRVTVIGYSVLTLFKSYVYTLKDKVHKLDVNS
jgi:hypothetical protein